MKREIARPSRATPHPHALATASEPQASLRYRPRAEPGERADAGASTRRSAGAKAFALALGFALAACGQGYDVDDTGDVAEETADTEAISGGASLPSATDPAREADYCDSNHEAQSNVAQSEFALLHEAQNASWRTAALAAGYTVTVVDSTTDETGATGSFKVRLNLQPIAPVTLKFQVNDIGEGQLFPTQLTFTAADWSTDQTVTVTGRNDAGVDGTQVYAVLFFDSDSADARYNRAVTNVLPLPINFSNADDEYGIVGLQPKGNPGEWGSRAPASFKLSRRPTSAVTIALASTNTLEGVLSAPSLTWQASEWDVAKTIYVTGVDDEVPDADPSYNVTATASSSDSNFNGRTRSIKYSTFDDDWETRATSAAANPFNCSTFNDAGIPGTQLAFPAYPVQNTHLRQTGNNNAYTELRVLAVNLRSTYTRSWTDELIADELAAHAHAMNMAVHASQGLIIPVRTELTLEKHWDSTNFKTGYQVNPNCFQDCNKEKAEEVADCQVACDHYRFVNFDALGTELSRFVNTNNFDIIQVNFPYANSLVDGHIAKGYAWASVVANTPAKWYDGRATFWQRQPGATLRPNVYLHELVHLLEWGLERAGHPEMLNPHNDFWLGFPIRTSGESPHWDNTDAKWDDNDSSQAKLRAMFWTQLYYWNQLPSAAPVPLGVARTRSGLHNIVSTCPSPTEFRQRRVRR